MATLQASIQLHDRMSQALNHITQSMATMLNTFEATQTATDAGFNAAAMDSARQGIVSASAELVQYNEELRKAATIPAPRIPEPTWQRMSSQDVFMSSGAARFEEEIRSADTMARRLMETQQRISAQARNMRVTPPGMLNDVAAVENRMQFLQQRIRQLNGIPVSLRTDQTNRQLETLRGQLGQAAVIQEDLNEAMSRMDISSANIAYQRLNTMMESVERNIRDNLSAQDRFNQSVNEGASAAAGLDSKLKGVAMSVAAAFSVQKIIGLSDSVTQVTARLNLMNDGLQSTDQLTQQIFASAQRARAPFMDTAGAIAKMGLNAGNAFNSNSELIAFMEQVNKQFVIGGATTQEQSNAMIQLSQAMAAGALRGEELNSILDAAPGIARTIERNMGWAEGSIKKYAEKGAVSAQVVKASLLNMAEETNAQFNSIPMTFGQVVTSVQNTLLQAFWPVIQAIGKGATFINEHWETIAPIFYGAAAGAIALAVGLGIQAAATWLAVEANRALLVGMLSNPLTWIVLAIGLVVAAIYKWVQSVGGIKIAWLICVNAVLTNAEMLQMGLMVIWHKVQNGLDLAQLGFMALKTGVLNALGALKVGGLIILQDFINGAIDRINQLITLTNRVAGTSIETIARVEFGANAAIEEKGKQKKRADEMAAQRDEIRKNQKARAQEEYWAAYKFNHNRMNREAEIERVRAENAADQAAQNDISKYTGDTAGNTAKMADTMDILDEDLKYMRDAAEQEVINRFTLAELKVDVKNSNTLTKKTDFDDMGRYLSTFTNEFLAAAAEGGHL